MSKNINIFTSLDSDSDCSSNILDNTINTKLKYKNQDNELETWTKVEFKSKNHSNNSKKTKKLENQENLTKNKLKNNVNDIYKLKGDNNIQNNVLKNRYQKNFYEKKFDPDSKIYAGLNLLSNGVLDEFTGLPNTIEEAIKLKKNLTLKQISLIINYDGMSLYGLCGEMFNVIHDRIQQTVNKYRIKIKQNGKNLYVSLYKWKDLKLIEKLIENIIYEDVDENKKMVIKNISN